MSDNKQYEGVLTAYPVESIKKQEQHGGPGLDAEVRVSPLISPRLCFDISDVWLDGTQRHLDQAGMWVTEIFSQHSKCPAQMHIHPPRFRSTDWDDNGKPYLKEYVGTGKLQGKAALITGGDSGTS